VGRGTDETLAADYVEERVESGPVAGGAFLPQPAEGEMIGG
jgi:hypothetical protein